jgi:large subunit ribosomal protein L1
MPNPKLGTVTFEIAKAVAEQKAGKVEFRLEKAGIIHSPVGKRSFGVTKLKDNILALIDAVNKAKPAASKGTYLKSMSISATMTPGLRIDATEFGSKSA